MTRIRLEADQAVVVFGVSVAFMYMSYWAAVETKPSPESMILLAVIKAGYVVSSFLALNSLLMLGKINDGKLPDLDSKADIKDLMLCNGLLMLVLWLSEVGLLAVSLKPFL